jgi:hypothetical protein
MWTTKTCFQATIIGAAVWLAAAGGSACRAAAPEQPVAGKQAHFPNGTWSALPQIGPDGKVRQCVLVAPRPRSGPSGPIATALSLTIGRGSGLAMTMADDKLPAEDILDDEAEVIVDGQSFPAVAFTVGGARDLAIHPGDAAGVLAALAKATALRLRSDGDGVDTGNIGLDLPGAALAWLAQCGKQFDIAIDRPTDPNAPPLPVPRPRAPEIVAGAPVGLAGLDNKWKISGWDASELRDGDGKIAVCIIRQHYVMGSGPGARTIGTFLIVSRSKGLTMMLKDSSRNLPGGQPVEAALKIGDKPFTEFSAQVLGNDEIGIFPQHGTALALALGDGAALAFKVPPDGLQFPVPGGIVPWLRACTRRSGFGFEPQAAKR